MKKIFYSTFSFLVLATVAFAQQEFVPLATNTPVSALNASTTPLFLESWIEALIGIAGVLAVIWIAIGGIQYMTTDSFENKLDGKKKIQDALLGLLLVITSWLILYTIDRRILDINLKYDPINEISGDLEKFRDAGNKKVGEGEESNLVDREHCFGGVPVVDHRGRPATGTACLEDLGECVKARQKLIDEGHDPSKLSICNEKG